ncbi:hypothetical protein [Roseivirga seohaensis]|uniref:hypothetical protein n=1 Tax=Roseivirga seohaensis TaxID=1914963 RepID=UPI003BA96C7C
MGAPSFAKFPGQVQTQGSYPWDPRNVVGADNSRYDSKDDIPLVDRFQGLTVFDAPTGKFWMLIGGTANEDYVDVFGLFVTLATANVANGYAALDGAGKISTSVLPALAIGDTFVEDSEVDMLALVAEIGDVCKRTDEGKTYVLQGADPSILGSWVDISSNFSGGVESVNGKTDTNVTLNLDEIPDGPTYKRVTQTEKNTWNGKQDALLYDVVPTFNSTKIVNSGDLFNYLKTLQSSVNNQSWLGSEADGDNRFHLSVDDEDIDQMIFFTEGGVQQHEGVHYTVDAEKRYIEFLEAPTPTQTYYAKWLSNIPIVSLTTVAKENVEGLLDEEGKVNEELLPEGIGGRIIKTFNPVLLFDKNYQMKTTVGGAIAFTLDNTGAIEGKSTVIYMKANGINKPTFSGDFYINSDLWQNTLNTWNRVYLEYKPSGRVMIDITYEPLP